MFILTLLAAITVPAQASDATGRSLHDIRGELRATLRSEATAETLPQRAQAIERLVEIFGQIQQDPRLPESPFLQAMQGQLHNRLDRVADRLQRPAVRPARVPKPARLTVRQVGILAPGRVAPTAVRPPQGQRDLSQQLVELIQSTIAPSTWDVNGGPSTIVYWPQGHALVVRAPERAHRQLRQALQGLRAAGGP